MSLLRLGLLLSAVSHTSLDEGVLKVQVVGPSRLMSVPHIAARTYELPPRPVSVRAIAPLPSPHARTHVLGMQNCSICDDEYNPNTGVYCGYHYTAQVRLGVHVPI